MMKDKITRRHFLTIAASSAAGAVISACASQPAPPTEAPQEAAAPATEAPKEEVEAAAPATEAPKEEVEAAAPATEAPKEEAAAAAPSGKYKEAPMLADLVAAGELPPVDERLPKDPRVITPLEEVGQYGGTWRRAYKGVSDRWGPTKLHEEMAIEWDVPDPETINVTPGFVAEWTQNDDATEFTFKLREGIRWSDGEIFDTEDVKFWYDQMYMGGLQTQQAFYTLNETPMELEVIDQYSWKVKFAGPNPLLPITLAKSGGGPPGGPTMAAPQHYLSQFIPDTGGDEEMINAMVEEKGLGTWQELFGQAGDMQGPVAFWFLNPELPVINAWKVQDPAPADPMVMVRNPYFYQVDTDGNQLPYIDQITHDFFDSDEVFNVWIAEGRIDMQMRHVTAANFTLYKENEEAGGYRVLLWKAASTNALYPNINNPDPVLAELFSNPQFREALSIAINREEINELAYNGLFEPRQASPISGSPNYDPEFETRWAEYDPERASALLDELGLEMGADGIRMRPDGQPLEFSILHREQTGTPGADEMNLVAQYWGEIGLKVNQDVVERSLYEERVGNGEVDIGVWGCDRNSVVMADPGRYLGTIDDGPWAPLYGHWYVNGSEKQEEPPEDHIIREIWGLWEQARAEPDETKRNGIFQQLLGIHKEHPWMIGTVGEAPSLVIVNNNFRNFAEGFIADDTLRDTGSINPQQFFIQQA